MSGVEILPICFFQVCLDRVRKWKVLISELKAQAIIYSQPLEK